MKKRRRNLRKLAVLADVACDWGLPCANQLLDELEARRKERPSTKRR